MNRSKNELKQCFWCGSFDKENNHVTVSEDVPPRWLSGEKKVKKINCVPQCNECKNALSGLDDAVNGYFRYGAETDLEKVEQNTSWLNNKGVYARKIDLNGKEDYAQSNGCLLLWLRKLLVGLWYKENDTFFNGQTVILANWLSFDDNFFYISNIVTPKEISIKLQFNIDLEMIQNDYLTDFKMKTPFSFSFIPSSRSGVELPLQLLRFAIYGRYPGYCLYIPEMSESNLLKVFHLLEKDPLYIKYWLRGYPYYPPSDVVSMVNSLKSISAEEAAKRVR